MRRWLWCLALAGALACAGAATASAAGAPSYVQVAGSPFATGPGPIAVAFSPDSGLLASANPGDDTVSTFSVSPGGRLTPVPGSPFATGRQPASVAFSPRGGLLADANAGDGTVSVFAVAAGGQLTPLAGSPFAAGRDPTALAFSPDGSLLAVTDTADATVSVYAVDARGGLTPVQGSPRAVGRGPDAVAFSPDGRLLAVGDQGGAVTMFNATTLAGVAGSPFTVGPVSALAFRPDGTALAVAGTGLLATYSVTPAGAITYVSGAAGAGGLAFSPDGTELVQGTAVYAITADGALTQPAGGTAATAGGQLAFSPNGAWLASPDPVGSAIDLAAQPPSAAIASPSTGGTVALGQRVTTSFACADAPGHPSLVSCVDSGGAAAPNGRLDTTMVGPHTYTVTATSADGLTATASVGYTVVRALQLQIRTGRVHVVDGAARVDVACRGGRPGQVCRGVMWLLSARRTAIFARAGFAVRPGHTVRVRLRLWPAALARLGGHGLKVVATASPFGATRAVTLSG